MRFLTQVFSVIALVSVMLSAAMPAGAQSLRGVSWTTPAGLVEADNWRTYCPGQCVVYEGDGRIFADDWPLVVVHEPVAETPQSFLRRWSAAQELGRGEPVTLDQSAREPASQGQITAMLVYLEPPQRRGGRMSSFLLIYEENGVILPVEIQALDRDDLSERVNAASVLLGTVRLDANGVRRASKAEAETVEKGRDAIAKGFSSGASVELFVNKDWQIQPTFGLSGMEMSHQLDLVMYALLPGGVLLTEMPQDLRSPDLRRMRGDGSVGSWSRSGDTYALTLTPGSGGPAISGPSFCYGCRGGDYRDGNVDWMVLGEAEWWAANEN